jgi:predicted alpha/beta hydrolase family esterase
MPKAAKMKVCAECGKSESAHWARHWKEHHPSKTKRELTPGTQPTDPYDKDWMYLLPKELQKFHEEASIK